MTNNMREQRGRGGRGHDHRTLDPFRQRVFVTPVEELFMALPPRGGKFLRVHGIHRSPTSSGMTADRCRRTMHRPKVAAGNSRQARKHPSNHHDQALGRRSRLRIPDDTTVSQDVSGSCRVTALAACALSRSGNGGLVAMQRVAA